MSSLTLTLQSFHNVTLTFSFLILSIQLIANHMHHYFSLVLLNQFAATLLFPFNRADTVLHLSQPASIQFADQTTAENMPNIQKNKGTQSQHQLQVQQVQTAQDLKVFTKYSQLHRFQWKKNPQKQCGCVFEKPIHLQTCYSH